MAQMERMLQDLSRMYRERNQALEEVSRTHHEALYRLALAAEYRDDDTGAHIVRIGFSELGQARKLAGMFGDIHAAGQRMLALVNDLLDVTKIESTVGTFHLERVDVRGLVRDVLANAVRYSSPGTSLQVLGGHDGPGRPAAPGWAWPSAARSCRRTAAASAPRTTPAGAPRSTSRGLRTAARRPSPPAFDGPRRQRCQTCTFLL
jgi:signal transduction histidine kinase